MHMAGFFFTALYFVENRVHEAHKTIIINGFRGGFLFVMGGMIWRCSRKGTLVSTGFPPSGALELRSLEYTQVSACVWALSRPMMCFPTSPLKKIHEVPKGEAAVSLQTVVN